MSETRTIGVGVVGLGFMGRTHVRAYRDAGARLVAVCDADAERLSGQAGGTGNLGEVSDDRPFNPDDLHATRDLGRFLGTPGLELVSICTPTDTHAGVATAALRAGKHVLIEKPVALDARTVASIRDEAARADRLCMPAMCMRFWPAWSWVKQAIDDGRYGPARAMHLERLAGPPAWSQAFYENEARSGGALFDLHLHDTDFVVHCFGVPHEVTSVGNARHLTSVYRFERGPTQVVAHGGWAVSPAWAFRMRFVVEFERAIADFDLGRAPELRVHTTNGETLSPELGPATGWTREIRAMVDAVAAGSPEPPVTMHEAIGVTRVLGAERESLRAGVPVRVEPA